jgi:hypothetical protein
MGGATRESSLQHPAADITLPSTIVSHGYHGAVALEPHRMIVAYSDLDDVRPVANIALPIAIPSHGDHGAVGLKPHPVLAEACAGDIPKVGDDIVVTTHGDVG